MKVYVYSAQAYEKQILLEASSGKHELVFDEAKLSPDTVENAKDCQAISIFTADDCSGPVLEKLSNLGVRNVALRSVGYDQIDINTAKNMGIHVANVPDFMSHAVAEHAVAMLLAIARKLHESQLMMELQDFRISPLKGFEIFGKTVGVIGAGKIGMNFARIMKGFGATVIANDPQQNPEAAALGITYDSFEEVLRKSDIVSLHCPLTAQTNHLIANPQFGWIKQGCIFINTSRGAIINTVDLIEAIENGRVGAACLDVYEFEKDLFFADHGNDLITDTHFAKLRSFKNVFMTGHQAFLTTEAVQGMASSLISTLDNWEKGDNERNPLINLY